MQQCTLRVTLFLLMLFAMSGLKAQNKIYFHYKDGARTSLPLNEIRKLTFPSRTINLYQNDGITKTFPFVELRQARFTEFLSGNNSLDVAGNQLFTLFPIPVVNDLNLLIGAASETSIEIRILDIQGKTICIRHERIVPGNNQISLPLAHLPQGLYICRVANGKSTETRKFLKN